MTSAATPKGLRRRSRLVEAAGDLLREGGFDAIRHRAVADRAQLPLASTTYYFDSLEELMAEAAACLYGKDERDIAARREALPTRRRGSHATAEALAEVFVGPRTPLEVLATRYETIALAARYPRLRAVVSRRRPLLSEMHGDVLRKSHRRTDPTHIDQLISVEDGAVVGALSTGRGSPCAAVREALAEVIDILAPPE